MTPGSRRNADTPNRAPLPGPQPTAAPDGRAPTTGRALLVGALAVLVGLVAVTLTPAPTPAAGQTSETPPSLRIVDQTTFAPADGAIELVVEVRAPDRLTALPTTPSDGDGDDVGDDDDQVDAGPVLSVAFFGRLSTEAEVDDPPTEALNRLPALPLNRAPRTVDGNVRLTIPIRSGADFDDQDRVLLPEPGVYPITVELRDADGPLATVRTHVVRQPIETADEPTQAPVEVGVVLHVTTAEGLSPAEATSLLGQHPTVPLTVILDHGVINQLRGDPAAAQALSVALAGRPVLTAPTIDLDPSALAEIGHGDLYLTAAEADRRALVALGLQPAAGQALLSTPLTEAGLDVLDDQGVEAVIDLGDRFLGSGVLEPRGRAIEVVRTDADLNRILRGPEAADEAETGPQRANRVLARLTLRRDIDDRPVVVGGPALGVDPAPALTAFLQALSQPGAPQPVPLSAIRGGPTLRVAERPQQDLAGVADLVDDLRARLETYESFHLDGGSEPDSYRQRIVGALTRQRNPDDRLRALTLIAGQLDDDLGTIHIHQPQPVTLAARSASIPLVVDNSASGPRHVVLRFRGDRVTSPDDGRLVLVQPGTSSIDIDVEARSLGVSPLEVQAWTPDGSVALAEARFEIRSTAVPGLGLLVSLSALGLLGVWWIVDHRRRRRAAAVTDGGSSGDEPTLADDALAVSGVASPAAGIEGRAATSDRARETADLGPPTVIDGDATAGETMGSEATSV